MSKIKRNALIGLLLPAVALLLFAISGCEAGENQRRFEAEAMQAPSGITRTDADGRIIRDENGRPVEEDPDDWRTAPLYIGRVSFDPAFPNPTRGEDVYINFMVRFEGIAGGLTLRGYDDAGWLRELDRVEAPFGAQQFRFNPAQFSTAGVISAIRGLHRVWVFDDRGSIVSYGDIRVE